MRTARLTNQGNSGTNFLACCSFRHGLRRATFLREEGFWFAQSKLVSPSGRDVAQRQRGLAPSLRELDLPQAKTEGVLQIGKIRMRFALIRIG